MLKRLGCVAIAWSKADPGQKSTRAETIAPHAFAPLSAASPCTVKPIARVTEA